MHPVFTSQEFHAVERFFNSNPQLYPKKTGKQKQAKKLSEHFCTSADESQDPQGE